jgi:hypothetical protein
LLAGCVLPARRFDLAVGIRREMWQWPPCAQ